MAAEHPAFQCVVISPSGKLIDCQAVSVILPAHDGEIGILHNHMPLLCKLGLGVVKISTVPHLDLPNLITVFVDGGFALLAQNNLTITAIEAVSSQDATEEKINKLIEKDEKALASAENPQQRLHLTKKVSLLKRFSDIKNRAAMPAQTE